MKKIRRKALRLTSAALAVGMVTPAFAAGWQNGVGANAGKWWYATNNENTAWHTNGWQWLDGNNDGTAECYYFGPDGYIAQNGTTPDNYTVNADGKWTINGVIQTKSTNDYGKNGSWKQGKDANAGKWWFDNGDGTYRKGGWHWLDGNKDGVAECYYFDNDGWLIANGTTPDGYTVNADGAWIKDGAKQTRSSGLKTSTGTSGYASFGGGGGGGGSSSGGSASSSTTSGGSSSSGNSSSGTTSADKYSSRTGITYTGSSESANNFTTANYGMMSSSEKKAVAKAIADFKAEYITDGMSEFEKEMAIIKWMVKNIKYEIGKDWTRSTAYAGMIIGKAQCSGYADTFLQMAKACGLEARYVHNNTHAWNLVRIDGKWYHVDVTWADGDSKSNPEYVLTGLVNLTDDEVKKLTSSHDKWSPTTIKCTGGEYGQSYFKALEQAELDKKTEKELKELANNNRGYQVIEYTTADATSSEVSELIKNKKISQHGDIMRSQTVCYVHMNSTSLNKVKSAVSELETAISEKVQPFAEQYRAENSYKSAKIHFQESYDSLPNGTYYVTLQSFVDIADKEYKYSYKINYIDADDKTTVISTESGVKTKAEGVESTDALKSLYVDICYSEIPEGYEAVLNNGDKGDYCEVISGTVVSNGSKGFRMYLSGDAEVNVYVSKILSEDEKPRVNYTISYVDINDCTTVVGTQTGSVTETTGVVYEVPEGYHVTSNVGSYGKVLTGNGGVYKKQAGVVVNKDGNEDYTAIVYVGKDYTSSSAKASVIEIIEDEEEAETVTYEVAEEELVEEETITEEISETAAETETDPAAESEKSSETETSEGTEADTVEETEATA